MAEVPVNWADQDGSRLSLAREFRKIVGGLARLRRRAELRAMTALIADPESVNSQMPH